MTEQKIAVTGNGPYLVEGGVPIAHQHIVTNAEGESLEWREGAAVPAQAKYALCRCGRSGTKPFCDGTHRRIGFDGTETASHEPFESQAGVIDGPVMVLEDAEGLCAFAASAIHTGKCGTSSRRAIRALKLVEHEAGHCSWA